MRGSIRVDELWEEALLQFNKIIKTHEYTPALINVGNIYYLQGQMERAPNYYERASAKASGDSIVLLCMARVNHDLENYGLARESYQRLKRVDPNLANQFSYLDLRGKEAARAAEWNAVKGVVAWAEE